MGYARKNLVSLQDTPYSHPKLLHAFGPTWMWGMQVLQEHSPAGVPTIHGGRTASGAACGAWLLGRDAYFGKDYSHREQWVIERLEQLCSMFSIEVCA